MTLQSPADVEQISNVDTLVAEGQAAIARGDKPTARAALRKARELAPERIDGLLALAEVVGTFAERREIYEYILEREPANEAAKQGLDDVIHGRVNPHSAPVLEPTKEPPPRENRPLPQPAVIEACYRHPDRETGLHCFQCDRPICAKCSFQTPVGMICPECRKARRSPLYDVSTVDAVKAAGAGLLAGALGGFVAVFIGGIGGFFLFFIIFMIGAAIGEGVMRIISWGTRKRGPIIQIAASLGVILGTLAVRAFLVINPLVLLIFLGIAIFTIVQRLK